MNVENIQQKIREFVAERDWDKYHTPKNVAIALSVEAAELLEIFQWMSDSEANTITQEGRTYEKIREEIADTQIYLLRLADLLKLDLEKAVEDKFQKNTDKYPVEKAKGNFVKYSERR